ncbi:hypothetical protein WBG06_05800 [Nocardioides sp. CCNWLW239]|uniref:lipopolysaccharide biosynthesis protein n=1 Tax=Nocardioides sp. CCNWLW239 TaxID=3128902 RepID=UPI003016253D
MMASTMVGVVATFGLSAVVGNLLGAAGAGEFFQVTAVFTIVSSISVLGAETTMVRMTSRAMALGKQVELRTIAFVGVLPPVTVAALAGVALWVWPEVAQSLVAVPGEDGVRLVRAIGLALPFAVLLAVCSGGVRGLGKPVAATSLQSLALPGLRLAAVVGALVVTASTEDAFLAWLSPLPVLGLIALALLVRAVRRRTRSVDGPIVGTEPVGSVVGEFWRFSLPRGVSIAVERSLDWVDVLLVIQIAGPAAGGIYAIVSRLAVAGTVLDTAARVTWGPQVSAALARGEADRARRLFDMVTMLLVGLGWPAYATLAVFAPTVLAFFGPEFPAGATALRVMCAAMMVLQAAGMLQTFLLMGGRSHWQMSNRLVQLALLISGCLILVPRLGILGAALAWSAAVVVDAVLATIQVRRIAPIGSSWRSAVLVGLPALALFGGGGAVLVAVLGQTPLALVAVVALGVPYVVVAFSIARRRGLLDRTEPVPEAAPDPAPAARATQIRPS